MMENIWALTTNQWLHSSEDEKEYGELKKLLRSGEKIIVIDKGNGFQGHLVLTSSGSIKCNVDFKSRA